MESVLGFEQGLVGAFFSLKKFHEAVVKVNLEQVDALSVVRYRVVKSARGHLEIYMVRGKSLVVLKDALAAKHKVAMLRVTRDERMLRELFVAVSADGGLFTDK